MVAIVIPNATSFGGMTNSVVSRIAGINTSIIRLSEAVATASAGFTGTPGTEFETSVGAAGVPTGMGANNFGVVADPTNLGANGQAYADAVTQLTAQWQMFWTAAAPFLKTLDNGTPAMTGGI